MSHEKEKQNVKESLEFNFINNKRIVEKEMNLLNLLLGAFSNNAYTYDEYCNCRMKFETEACDNALDVNIEEELQMSDYDMNVIQNNAMRKSLNGGVDFEDVMDEEIIKWKLDKCYKIDSEMYYQISKYSSIRLVKNKIPDSIWKKKKKYFEDICDNKARKAGESIANDNQEKHEQDIRSSLI